VTWISVSYFISQVRRYHVSRMEGLEPDELTLFPDEPKETSVQCTFVPTSPYRGKTMLTGRLNIARTIQKRSSHIDHEDTHYCHSQHKVTKVMCVKANDTFEKEYNQGNVPASSCLSDFFISVESDDKSTIPFGSPGRAIDTNACPHGRILACIEHQASSDKSPRARVAEALAHIYHLRYLSASVNLFQEIPSLLEQSWAQVLMIVQSLWWLRFYSFAKPAVLLDYSLEVR
jgi:hypothetical protein